jgi:farnesyl diphosphate synthase
LAHDLRAAAQQALQPLGEAGLRLADLADFIVQRDR